MLDPVAKKRVFLKTSTAITDTTSKTDPI